jgi:hypothetical protein
MDREAELRRLYAAFNARDIDACLAGMTPDVDWPNGWEGGSVRGHDEVRAYWTRQWEQVNPRVEPVEIRSRPDGDVAVRVHQTVRGPSDEVLSDGEVEHVYRFRGGLVERMTISS